MRSIRVTLERLTEVPIAELQSLRFVLQDVLRSLKTQSDRTFERLRIVADVAEMTD